MNTDIIHAEKFLNRFINSGQLQVLRGLRRSEDDEEGEWFRAKMIEMAERIETMPVTYQTDGQGDKAIAYLRYYLPVGFEWFITERDIEREQLQAFGLASLGMLELGYISIVDILDNGAELDLHFNPKPLHEVERIIRYG